MRLCVQFERASRGGCCRVQFDKDVVCSAAIENTLEGRNPIVDVGRMRKWVRRERGGFVGDGDGLEGDDGAEVRGELVYTVSYAYSISELIEKKKWIYLIYVLVCVCIW